MRSHDLKHTKVFLIYFPHTKYMDRQIEIKMIISEFPGIFTFFDVVVVNKMINVSLCIRRYHHEKINSSVTKKPTGCQPSHVSLNLQSLWYHRPHYSDIITNVMVSQITSLMIVYSTIYSGTDQRKQRNIKCSRHWPLWGESTSLWIPLTKGQ